MNIKHVENLERHLMENEKFHETMEYFLANFGDHPNFTKSSKKVKIKFLRNMIGEALKGFFKKSPIVMVHLQMTHHERLHIYHGVTQTEGYLVIFFYCIRIHRGMIVLNKNNAPSTEYIRITPQPLNAGNEILDEALSDDELDFNLN